MFFAVIAMDHTQALRVDRITRQHHAQAQGEPVERLGAGLPTWSAGETTTGLSQSAAPFRPASRSRAWRATPIARSSDETAATGPCRPVTDARFYTLYGGAQATCYGPEADLVHGIDESVGLASVHATTRVLALTMAGRCGVERAG